MLSAPGRRAEYQAEGHVHGNDMKPGAYVPGGVPRPIRQKGNDVSFSNKLSNKQEQSKTRLQSIINDKKRYMNQNKVIEEGTQYDDCCN